MRAESVVVPPESEDDWGFCRDVLFDVSRTFSQPIGLLPEPLQKQITVGYLLCRLADTIEDTHDIDPLERERQFALLIAVLQGEKAPSNLAGMLAHHDVPAGEQRVIRGVEKIFSVLSQQSHPAQEITRRWVVEMADGMREYSRRAQGRELFVLQDIADLERYCYFVAGTVGHMITELFTVWTGDEELEPKLSPYAESFGLGLQMVNIIKDLADDFQRGVCYLPETLCRQEALSPELLLSFHSRNQATRATRRLIERAFSHLDDGFRYTLVIPAEQPKLRLFCLLPLWMAVETLNLATQTDPLIDPQRKIKISRNTVGKIVTECAQLVGNDSELQKRYEAMRDGSW